ncbi:MAG TPA: hypothetical protein VI136_00840 [Verrucomicrobiae bacterium]
MNLSAMLSNHPFWGLLMLAVLVWYSTITVYVAVRGAMDIRQMLRKLNTDRDGIGEEEPPREP